MGKKPQRAGEPEEALKAPSIEKSVSRIAALVGLHLAKEGNQQEQAFFFWKAGFSAPEIGQMLDIPANQVHASLFAMRKKGQDTEKKRKARK